MGEKIYSNKTEEPQKIKSNKIKEILGLVLYCVIVIAVMFLVIKYVGQRTVVIGDSMENTLQDGDNLITDKLTYRFIEPKRFDIVVFPFKDNKNQLLIKRIIGLPGETVQIMNGKVYINEYELNENYGNAIIESAGLAANPIRQSNRLRNSNVSFLSAFHRETDSVFSVTPSLTSLCLTATFVHTSKAWLTNGKRGPSALCSR